MFRFHLLFFAAEAVIAAHELNTFSDSDEAFSLLQLRASSASQRWVDDHSTRYYCQMYGDPHVAMTFSTTDPKTGDRRNQPDFNGGAGIFHATKSDKCGLDIQMYNCPISRKSNVGNKYRMTMIQGLAIKSGDDLIQIAYKPLDVSKYKLTEFVGLTQEQWIQKVNDYCPEVDTDRVVQDFNHDGNFRDAQRAVGSPGRDAFAKDFHLWYRAWTKYAYNRYNAPSRCEHTLWGVPLFPVITVNGVEQPDWDTECYRNKWYNNDHKSQDRAEECRPEVQREIGSGIIQVRPSATDKPGLTVLKHPEGLWEVAYLPTAQQAEPILAIGNNWTQSIASETRWKYFDPEWETELWVKPECFDTGSVVPDTVCNAPVMRYPPQPGDELTYPTVAIPPEESLFTADVLERMCHTCNWNPGAGKTRVEWKWTGDKAHEDPQPLESPMQECVMPEPDPVPSPPPSPVEVCQDFDVSVVDAQAACSHMTDENLKNACIMDFCASGGNPVIPALEENEGKGTPLCVGSSCDPKAVCDDATLLDLSNVKQNNLGGLGPDAGEESLIYSNAASIGGRAVDVVVTVQSGSYSARKPQMNGVDNGLGTLALNSGTSVSLNFAFVDSEDGTPVSPSTIAFTVLDLDTGKKGKAAESVEVCDADSAIVSSPSSLQQTIAGGCTQFKATEPGNAADNPTSANELDETQAGRTATYQLESRSEFSVKLAIEKGSGQRLFRFAFHPAIACSE